MWKDKKIFLRYLTFTVVSFAVIWGHSTFKKLIWNIFCFMDFWQIEPWLPIIFFINSDPVITFFVLSLELAEIRWSTLPSLKAISSHSLFQVFLALFKSFQISNNRWFWLPSYVLLSLTFYFLELPHFLCFLGFHLSNLIDTFTFPPKIRRHGFCRIFSRNCSWYPFLTD